MARTGRADYCCVCPFIGVKRSCRLRAVFTQPRPGPVISRVEIPQRSRRRDCRVDARDMQYGVITVSPDESVDRVMKLMTHHRLRHMPVLRDGKLAGIISIGDVVKHRLEDLELETNVLRDAYIAAR